MCFQFRKSGIWQEVLGGPLQATPGHSELGSYVSPQSKEHNLGESCSQPCLVQLWHYDLYLITFSLEKLPWSSLFCRCLLSPYPVQWSVLPFLGLLKLLSVDCTPPPMNSDYSRVGPFYAWLAVHCPVLHHLAHASSRATSETFWHKASSLLFFCPGFCGSACLRSSVGTIISAQYGINWLNSYICS